MSRGVDLVAIQDALKNDLEVQSPTGPVLKKHRMRFGKQKQALVAAALDVLIDTYEHKVGPRNGARVVAKAWCDPAYKIWLREDAGAAIASLGITGRQGEHMAVVEGGGIGEALD